MKFNRIYKNYVRKVLNNGDMVVEEVFDWDIRNIAEDHIKYIEFYTESFYEENNEKKDVRVLMCSPKVYFGKRIDLDTAKKNIWRKS